MEPKFQTSFIPRKNAAPIGISPLRPTPKVTPSVYFIVAIIVFVLSLGAVGGAFAWKGYLTARQTSYKQQLSEKEKHFDPASIQTLKAINSKIDLANQVLRNHVAVSRVFGLIGKFTAEKVRFTNLTLNADQTVTAPGTGSYKIALKGYGVNMTTVAFQSDVLGQLADYGLRSVIKNPIMTDPTLEQNNSISFNLTADIDPASLLYSSSFTTPTSTSTNP